MRKHWVLYFFVISKLKFKYWKRKTPQECPQQSVKNVVQPSHIGGHLWLKLPCGWPDELQHRLKQHDQAGDQSVGGKRAQPRPGLGSMVRVLDLITRDTHIFIIHLLQSAPPDAELSSWRTGPTGVGDCSVIAGGGPTSLSMDPPACGDGDGGLHLWPLDVMELPNGASSEPHRSGRRRHAAPPCEPCQDNGGVTESLLPSCRLPQGGWLMLFYF